MGARKSEGNEQALIRAWLRKVLDENDMNASQLASLVDVSHTTLTRFLNSEDAQHSLSVPTITAIVRRLKVEGPRLGATYIDRTIDTRGRRVPVFALSQDAIGVVTKMRGGGQLKAVEHVVVPVDSPSTVGFKILESRVDREIKPQSIVIVDYNDRRLVAGKFYLISHGVGQVEVLKYTAKPAPKFESDTLNGHNGSVALSEVNEIAGRIVSVFRDL